jgi:hypothetical protein
VTPALTTVKTGALAGFEAEFVIVFSILPERPATFDAEKTMHGRKIDRAYTILAKRALFMIFCIN